MRRDLVAIAIAVIAVPFAALTLVPIAGAGAKSVAHLAGAASDKKGTQAPVRHPVIVLDPGHGGSDTGAVHYVSGRADLMEKNVTLALALRAAKALRHDGFTVYMTRTSDRAVNTAHRDLNHDGLVDEVDELEARVAFADRHHADLFVSMHINGSDSADSRGLTVYYCPAHSFAADNVRLAKLLDASILQRLRTAGYTPRNWGAVSDVADVVPQRYADYPWFFVIGPKAPKHGIIGNGAVSALGETLYATNDYEAALLHRGKVLDAIAAGYVHGIEQYMQQTSRR